MTCKFCGNEIEEGASFCFICGQPVEVEAAPAAEAAPVEEAAPAAEAVVPAAAPAAPVAEEAAPVEEGKKGKKGKKQKGPKDPNAAGKFTLFICFISAIIGLILYSKAKKAGNEVKKVQIANALFLGLDIKLGIIILVLVKKFMM